MTGEELIAFVRKNLIVVICAVVTVGLGFAIYYTTDDLPNAEKILADKTQQGELLAANIEDSNQLKEQYATLIASNQVISDRMIHTGQLAENLQYFYRLESDTGTKLTDLRQQAYSPPAKSSSKTSFIPISFGLTAQGDYPQIIDVLRRLENGEHYCREMSLSLRPIEERRGSQLVLGLSLELLGQP
jgi:hypothetical protein